MAQATLHCCHKDNIRTMDKDSLCDCYALPKNKERLTDHFRTKTQKKRAWTEPMPGKIERIAF